MKAIVLTTLCICSLALLTSHDFKKQGIDVRNKTYDYVKSVGAISTSCNVVNLNVAPYNYGGVVRSGYLNVGNDKGESALGFIFYGRQSTQQSNLKNYPTIIWLNGGPGSSSQLGNMMELGPFWLTEPKSANSTYDIIPNEWTWIKDYNVLFVDQPVGTGLSYADPKVSDPYTYSQDEVASDFYNALLNLYQNSNGCFKQLNILPSQDLFIIGESYAGKYVPAIAMHIVAKSKDGGPITGLKGVSIGDGFTQPYDILAELGGFAYNIGLLDYGQRARVEQLIINATFQYNNKQWTHLHDSFDNILDYIATSAGGVNVYDFTKYKPYASELLNTYFNDPTIRELYRLNADLTFDRHSSNVYRSMYEDFMKPYTERVEYLLNNNIPVLVYNGQNDIIVETPGTMRWVEKLHYKDSDEFDRTPFKTWKVNDKVAGSYKKAGKLELKIVNNAGHMIPMDQGENCLNMVRSFIDPLRVSTL